MSVDHPLDREELEKYLAPGAINAFLEGVKGAEREAIDGQTNGFAVPPELLVTMPIAHVTPGTVIIPVNNRLERNVEPTPSTSGLGTNTAVPVILDNHEDMEVETLQQTQHANTAQAPTNKDIPTQDPNTTSVSTKPKKGYLTKNSKKTTPAQTNNPEAVVDDQTVQMRIQLLQEIAEIMRNKSGGKKNELELWSSYIGSKMERVPEGPVRDDVLVSVEKSINKAIHGNWVLEE